MPSPSSVSVLRRPTASGRRAFGIATFLAFGVAGLVTRAASQDDGLVVEGLRGTIPTAAVSQVVAARMDDLVRCVRAGDSPNELVSGSVTLGFVIGRDGATRSARVVASDIGDRAAERCMLQIGSQLRFARPTGGDAEASDRVRIPLDPEVRPAVTWTEERVRSTAGAAIDRLASRCRVTGGQVRVTAYVGRGGNVMGAGAFASRGSLDGTVECVLDGVRRLPMPSPGSYPAKVTFSVGR